MRRRSIELLQGVTALLLLAGLLIGIPAALVAVVGWPLPTELPDWTSFERVLTTGQLDTGTLVKALAVVVWVSWAQLASSAIAEAVAIVRGRRMPRIPSARPLRLAAANLVTTAALLFGTAGRLADAAVLPPPDIQVALATGPPSTPTIAADSPARRPSPAGPRPAVDAAAEEPLRPAATGGHTEAPVWRVEPRDTLWGIAETTLNDGLRWREIHQLNVGRRQPDGGALRAGDDLIRPGWILTLPRDASLSEPAATAPEQTTRAATDAATDDETTTVTVEPGDTLWDLAQQHLGDPHRWPEVYDANRDRPQPDGRSLTDPDLIHPGWHLTIPTATTETVTAPLDPPPEPAPTERPEPEAEAAPPAEPLPWAQLDRAPPSPPPSVTDTAPATPPRNLLHDSDAADRDGPAEAAARQAQGQAASHDATDPSDVPERSVLLIGAGLAAAGIVLTLDRLRRSRQRRRAPGKRIQPPRGGLARAEWRVRGLADQDTADLLDVALRSLSARCAHDGRAVPDIALVSVGVDDVAIHLADGDTSPVDGWELADAGMTWVLPRPSELEPLRQLAATALSPAPLLVTIGTHADAQRRVLLNLGHARLVAIDASDEAARTTLLALTLELATTARADGLQLLLGNAADQLATLERVRCVPDSDVDQLLHRAIADADSEDADVTALVLLAAPPPALHDALACVAGKPSGTLAAIGPQIPDTPWRLTIDEATVRVAPHDIELQPLELSTDDIDAIAQLLADAADPTVVDADLAALDTFAPEPPEAHSTNGHATITVEPTPELADAAVEVRVLGPVEVAGAADFVTAKAEELVVYLALHRNAVDIDTLHEVLWPGQAPSAGRLHTTVYRARQALGEAPNATPYLPKANQGRYRLSSEVGSDLARFHEHLSRARSDPAHPAQELRAALELVRGQPLSATSADYAWATNEVHAIEQDISDAAHRLAELYLEQDQPEEARWAAERGLLADPYSELLYRDLMLAAAAVGNTTEIHATMQRLRQISDFDAAANDADDLLDPATTQLFATLTRQRAGGESAAEGTTGLLRVVDQ